MDNPRSAGAAFSAPRRVFTAPTAFNSREQDTTTANGGLVETLYHHPSVKIISFTAGPRPVFGNSKGLAATVEVEPGSLSWSSQLERTIAVGPFRIYRAPGSVAFLNCGSALQPILPKSQCWCVDEGSSKFVLQIRRPQYWRIEIPVSDEHEIRLALELRQVLDKVLQFEKTECPFKRTFTIELPERPQTPIKKRPWTPVRRASSESLPTPGALVNSEPFRLEVWREVTKETLPAEKSADAQHERMPISEEVLGDKTVGQTAPVSESSQDASVPLTKVDAAVSALEQIVQKEKSRRAVQDMLRPSGVETRRPLTAPSNLNLVTPPPSVSISEPHTGLETTLASSKGHSRNESHDSFHSIEAWASPLATLPPSPPLTATGSPQVLLCPQDHLPVQKRRATMPSKTTVTPNTPTISVGDSSEVHQFHDDEVSSVCSALSTTESTYSPPSTVQSDHPPSPTAIEEPVTKTSSSSSTATYASATSNSPVLKRRSFPRHTSTTSSSLSPSRVGGLLRMPSAADLFGSYRSQSTASNAANQSPPTPSKLSLVKRLPMAVIHKTCEIFFAPPSHLINLMLKVAARIAAGEWRGYVFGIGEQGERIPVRWDWSDEDDDGEGELGGWHADGDLEVYTQAAGGRKTPLRMAGAFPESPDEEDETRGRELGYQTAFDRAQESPTPLRRRPSFSVRCESREGSGGGSGSWSID